MDASEEKLLSSIPQIPISILHTFGPGVYIREAHFPKGSFIMGHHQNFEHVNVFVKGKIAFVAEHGEPVEMAAPMTFIGKPGRKIAFAIEDTIWMNVYATEETNIEKIEEFCVSKTEASKKYISALKELERAQHEEERLDFGSLIKQIGPNENVLSVINSESERLEPLPLGTYKFKTGESSIAGKGLFATAVIASAEIIAPAFINGKPTVAWRYVNHSPQPNAQMAQTQTGDIVLVALREITGCLGGLDGEEITVNYRQSLQVRAAIALEA